MWFKFPETVTSVSVEQQQFRPMAKSPDGRDCFAAPDHFTKQILGLRGFEILATVPPDFPSVPVSAPSPDVDQAKLLSEAQKTVMDISTELVVTRANLTSLLHERDELKLQLHESKTTHQNLLNDLEDAGLDPENLNTPTAKLPPKK